MTGRDAELETDRLSSDGPDETQGVTDDGPEPDEMFADEVEVELRPQRRLRIWQLAPIVSLAALGSLMFAFPLAFDFGDSGAVIAMLGLLICSCAAGWGMMAARRVGYTWPGLPASGLRRRPDWRVVLAYALVVAAWSSWPSGGWPACGESPARTRPAPSRLAYPPYDRGHEHADRLPQGARHRERLRDRPGPRERHRPAPGRRRRPVRPPRGHRR